MRGYADNSSVCKVKWLIAFAIVVAANLLSVQGKTQARYDSIVVASTDHQNPVQVAAVVIVDKKEKEFVLKMRIHSGYHLYAVVADTDPFIRTEVTIELPNGIKATGPLQYPAAKPFNLSGTMVYEEEILYRQKFSGAGKGELVCRITYQCCDATICFPPVDQTIKIKIS